jgi:V8-like Glu-specific endopeptidase
VARLSVPRVFHGHPDGKHAFGTGWLIAPGLLLTNHHVVEARDKRPMPFGLGESDARDEDIDAQVAGLEVWFDYHRDDPARSPTCRGAALKAKDRTLDFALLELDVTTSEAASRGALPLVPEQPQPERGRRANVVQHPGGRAMVLAIRNNFIVGPGPGTSLVRYQTDTESGASGSPVCDDDWRVIALHHGSTRVPSQVVPQEVMDGAASAVVLLNEATAIHAVLAAIKQQSPEHYARIVKANGWS